MEIPYLVFATEGDQLRSLTSLSLAWILPEGRKDIAWGVGESKTDKTPAAAIIAANGKHLKTQNSMSFFEGETFIMPKNLKIVLLFQKIMVTTPNSYFCIYI